MRLTYSFSIWLTSCHFLAKGAEYPAMSAISIVAGVIITVWNPKLICTEIVKKTA